VGIEDHGDEPSRCFPGAEGVFSAAAVVRARFFAAAVAFLSAGLLFSVQPHLGRRLLPTVGGGPAVWNACLVFFQTALLLGYGWAFVLIRRIPHRAMALHGIVLLASCVWLFAIAPMKFHAFESSPTLKTLALLFVSVGLPIVALSATAPFAHHWSSANDPGGDHYGVYAASNAGSLLALLIYPVMIEPNFGLDDQWAFWRWGFLALAAAMNGLAWKAQADVLQIPSSLLQRSDDGSAKLDLKAKIAWLFWSAAPSALLVSATQRITEDVAVGPMLWLPPLVCFLAASILAFAGRSPTLAVFAWMLPILLLIRGMVLAVAEFAPTLWIQLAVELIVLFIAAWCSFAVLYSKRPSDADAASFYVWLALGGALGGGLASLAAPHLFRSTGEHPLVLLLVCLCLPIRGTGSVCLQVFTLIGAASLIALSRPLGDEAAALEWLLLLGSVGMLMAVGMRRSLAFGLAVGTPIALLVQLTGGASAANVLFAERSEFGVHRVVRTHDFGDEIDFHALRHGGVVHGWQCREEGRSQEPLGYYHPESAVGEALDWNKSTSGKGDVAVVGLGAGAALVHRRSDQRFVFFEIDPTVVRIASDRRLFSYLSDAGNGAEIRIGDGRLLLEQTPDSSFTTIFLDAFGGDAVPTHLLTREAFATYVRKLKPGGVIIVNITNWYVDLEATLVKAGESVGLSAVGKQQQSERKEVRPGMAPTRCVVLAGDENRLAGLASRPGWRRLRPTPRTSLWTDDFCDLWSVVRWKR
jgi:hypothetical protein